MAENRSSIGGMESSVGAIEDVRGEPAQHDVEILGVSHAYGRTQVLTDVSLRIRKGEFFGILGPSGSGKSTTLRIIGGFVIPTAGEVYIQGELMGTKPPYRRNTTMVFQHLALFPHKKVFDNLAYGLKLRRVAKQEIKDRVAQALGTVQLSGLEERYPKQLSGGQQQRVALARALILEPGVVLFDEPLGSLDLKLRREMQIEVKNLQHRLGTTFVYVTHDQQEALTMCDRIAIMDQGKIEQIGTAEEIYERPRTRFVADFVGDTNFLDGRVREKDGSVATIESNGLSITAVDKGRFQVGDEIALSIRPERLHVGSSADTCDVLYKAQITDIIYTGAMRRLLLRLPNDMSLKADLDARTVDRLQINDEVDVGWYSEDAYTVTR
jgi:spermidine/putrescine transport system ATP-binding protein